MPFNLRFYRIVFVVSLVLWTIALLVPIPKRPSEALGSDINKLIFSKVLHVSAYAYLTILGSLINWPRRWPWAILILLSLHGFATEFLQGFVGRGSSLIDVGIDHIGITIGLIASWQRWRSPDRPDQEIAT